MVQTFLPEITEGWESEEFKAHKASTAKTRATPKPMQKGKAAVEKPTAKPKAKPTAKTKAKPLAKPKAPTGVITKFDKKVTQQAIIPASEARSSTEPTGSALARR